MPWSLGSHAASGTIGHIAYAQGGSKVHISGTRLWHYAPSPRRFRRFTWLHWFRPSWLCFTVETVHASHSLYTNAAFSALNKSYWQLSTYCNTCVCSPQCRKKAIAAAVRWTICSSWQVWQVLHTRPQVSQGHSVYWSAKSQRLSKFLQPLMLQLNLQLNRLLHLQHLQLILPHLHFLPPYSIYTARYRSKRKKYFLTCFLKYSWQVIKLKSSCQHFSIRAGGSKF